MISGEKTENTNAKDADREEKISEDLRKDTLPKAPHSKDRTEDVSIASTQTEPREHTVLSSKQGRFLRFLKGPTDETDPTQYSSRKKGMILFIISVAGGM